MPNSLVTAYRERVPNDPLSDDQLTALFGQQNDQDGRFAGYPDFLEDYARLKQPSDQMAHLEPRTPGYGEEFGNAVARGTRSLASTAVGLGALAAKPFSDSMSQAMAQKYQEMEAANAQDNPASVPNLEGVHNVDTAIRYGLGKAGEFVPNVAEAAAFGVAGAAAGTAAEPGAGTLAGGAGGFLEGFLAKQTAKSLLRTLVTQGAEKLGMDEAAGTIAQDQLKRLAKGEVVDDLLPGLLTKEASGKAIGLLADEGKAIAQQYGAQGFEAANFFGLGAGGEYGKLANDPKTADNAGVGALIAGIGGAAGAILPSSVISKLYSSAAKEGGEEVAKAGENAFLAYTKRVAKNAAEHIPAGVVGMAGMELGNIAAERYADPERRDQPLTHEELSRLMNAAAVGMFAGTGASLATALKKGTTPAKVTEDFKKELSADTGDSSTTAEAEPKGVETAQVPSSPPEATPGQPGSAPAASTEAGGDGQPATPPAEATPAPENAPHGTSDQADLQGAIGQVGADIVARNLNEKQDALRRAATFTHRAEDPAVQAARAKVEAAAAQTEKAPTTAQKLSGNYAKGKLDGAEVGLPGVTIAIETPKGEERTGVGGDGKPWSVEMPGAYGYFLGTVGKDKDHVDVTIGPNPKAETVYVVDQINPKTGSFDEHKTFLGFESQAQAEAAYDASFSDGTGPSRRGAVTAMDKAKFKDWLRDEKATKKPLKYEKEELGTVAGKIWPTAPEPTTHAEYRKTETELTKAHSSNLAELKNGPHEKLIEYLNKIGVAENNPIVGRVVRGRPGTPSWNDIMYDLQPKFMPKKSEAVIRDERANRLVWAKKELESWKKTGEAQPIAALEKEIAGLEKALAPSEPQAGEPKAPAEKVLTKPKASPIEAAPAQSELDLKIAKAKDEFADLLAELNAAPEPKMDKTKFSMDPRDFLGLDPKIVGLLSKVALKALEIGGYKIEQFTRAFVKLAGEKFARFAAAAYESLREHLKVAEPESEKKMTPRGKMADALVALHDELFSEGEGSKPGVYPPEHRIGVDDIDFAGRGTRDVSARGKESDLASRLWDEERVKMSKAYQGRTAKARAKMLARISGLDTTRGSLTPDFWMNNILTRNWSELDEVPWGKAQKEVFLDSLSAKDRLVIANEQKVVKQPAYFVPKGGQAFHDLAEQLLSDSAPEGSAANTLTHRMVDVRDDQTGEIHRLSVWENNRKAGAEPESYVWVTRNDVNGDIFPGVGRKSSSDRAVKLADVLKARGEDGSNRYRIVGSLRTEGQTEYYHSVFGNRKEYAESFQREAALRSKAVESSARAEEAKMAQHGTEAGADAAEQLEESKSRGQSPESEALPGPQEEATGGGQEDETQGALTESNYPKPDHEPKPLNLDANDVRMMRELPAFESVDQLTDMLATPAITPEMEELVAKVAARDPYFFTRVEQTDLAHALKEYGYDIDAREGQPNEQPPLRAEEAGVRPAEQRGAAQPGNAASSLESRQNPAGATAANAGARGREGGQAGNATPRPTPEVIRSQERAALERAAQRVHEHEETTGQRIETQQPMEYAGGEMPQGTMFTKPQGWDSVDSSVPKEITDPEQGRLFQSILQAASRAGIDVRLVRANLLDPEGAMRLSDGRPAWGSYRGEGRILTLALANAVVGLRDNMTFVHEVAHDAFASIVKANPEMGKRLLAAIAQVSDKDLGLDLSADPRIRATDPGQLGQRVLQEERLVEATTKSLFDQGFRPDEARTYAQKFVRSLKDYYYRATMAVQKMLGFHENPELARRYFENRMKQLLAGDRHGMSYLDFLGIRKPTQAKQFASWYGGGRSYGERVNADGQVEYDHLPDLSVTASRFNMDGAKFSMVFPRTEEQRMADRGEEYRMAREALRAERPILIKDVGQRHPNPFMPQTDTGEPDFTKMSLDEVKALRAKAGREWKATGSEQALNAAATFDAELQARLKYINGPDTGGVRYRQPRDDDRATAFSRRTEAETRTALLNHKEKLVTDGAKALADDPKLVDAIKTQGNPDMGAYVRELLNLPDDKDQRLQVTAMKEDDGSAVPFDKDKTIEDFKHPYQVGKVTEAAAITTEAIRSRIVASFDGATRAVSEHEREAKAAQESLANATVKLKAVTDALHDTTRIPDEATAKDLARKEGFYKDLIAKAKTKNSAATEQAAAERTKLAALDALRPGVQKELDRLTERAGIRPNFVFAHDAKYLSIADPRATSKRILNPGKGEESYRKTLKLDTSKGGTITPPEQIREVIRNNAAFLKERDDQFRAGDEGARDLVYQAVAQQQHEMMVRSDYKTSVTPINHWLWTLHLLPEHTRIADLIGTPAARAFKVMMGRFEVLRDSMHNFAHREGDKTGQMENELLRLAPDLNNNRLKLRKEILDPLKQFQKDQHDLEEEFGSNQTGLDRAIMARYKAHLLANHPEVRANINQFMPALARLSEHQWEMNRVLNEPLRNRRVGVASDKLKVVNPLTGKASAEKDKATGVATPVLRNPIGGKWMWPRKLRSGLDGFADMVKSLKSAGMEDLDMLTKGGEPGENGKPSPSQLQEALAKDPSEAAALLAPIFEHPEHGDNVRRVFFKNLAQMPTRSSFDAVGGDGGKQLVSPSLVKQAMREAGPGDPIGFAQKLFELQGGEGDSGAYVNSVVRRLYERFREADGMLKSYGENEEPSGVWGIKGMSPDAFIDAREIEHLPTQWFDFHSYDQRETAMLAQRIAVEAELGRGQGSAATTLNTAKAEGLAAQRRLASVRGELTAANPKLSTKKVEKLVKQKLDASAPGTYDRLSRQSRGADTIDPAVRAYSDYFRKDSDPDISLSYVSRTAHALGDLLVNNPASAIRNLEQLFALHLRYGAGGSVLAGTGHVLRTFASDSIKSLVQTTGHVMQNSNWADRLFVDLGYNDPDNVRQWKDIFVRQTGEGGANQVMRGISNTMGFGLNPAGEAGIHTVVRPLKLFTTGITLADASLTKGLWNFVGHFAGDGIEHYRKNIGDFNNPDFTVDAHTLGYNGADTVAFNRLTEDMKMVGLNFDQMVRESMQRNDGTPFSRDVAARLYTMGNALLSSESSLLTMPAGAYNSSIVKSIIPLLGWGFRRSQLVADIGRTVDGKRQLAAFSHGLGGLAILAAGGLGTSAMANAYSTQLLGKKPNLRPIVGNDLESTVMGIEENLARVGTFGFFGEGVNGMVNVGAGGDNRIIDLDKRIVALSAIGSLQNVVSTFINQGGQADYAHVLRPLGQSIGGGGLMQYMQLANRALGMDDQESRVNARINAQNWLRSAGRNLDMDVRESGGGGGYSNATPISPHLTKMELAAYGNNGADFQEAYRGAVAAAKAAGNPDPVDYVKRAYASRNPLRQIFRTPPSEAEYRRLLGSMPDSGSSDVREAVNLYNHYAESIGARAFEGKAEKKEAPPKMTFSPSEFKNRAVGLYAR